jgi:hypothetical protein
MMKHNLTKRLEVLESRYSDAASGGCDPKRRLAKYAAFFSDQPWTCSGSPEKIARRAGKLARYKEYFDVL